jgi:plasmid stabilization system protein ParE
MVKISWTNEAQNWLREIYDYIAIDNKATASKVIHGIYDKVQILISFPKIGYLYEYNKENEIRILLYGHYRIAYLIKDQEHIDILGVFMEN